MDGEISADELQSLLEDDAATVVDIRNPMAFSHGHIPDSLNIPLESLPREVEQLRDADRVVTVCPHGKASVRAARLIASFEGFEGRVDSLACGITGWDGPTTSEQDESSSAAPF
ncbi:Rhodanese-related sulfurtransferase [Halovenus aranensis]|jgi:rhodanese-related sulfurtransferase|uniref:Rhodanese-related sulfurtransferase n=1 Tax=Halovenus aranensis TaxID=890420 RepID=A0A1G8WCV1_9EURY|nr:rhodanese-like domain-containing protein [Halovenus aranensis]SDJ75575.1 Rhodanese-related sulfurtransferase [Halovenus aranensis]